jgi:hypothetical protein
MIAPGPDPDVVTVKEAYGACGVDPYEKTSTWTRVGDGYRLGDRWIAHDRIESLRALLLASNRETKDLLTTLDVTPDALEVHRKDLLEEFRAYTDGGGGSIPVRTSSDLEEVLRFPTFSQHVHDLIFDQGSCTTTYELHVTLPGTPPVTVSSESRVGWMIPCEVEVDHRIWSSTDIGISKALLPFVDAGSPLRWVLDGRRYWSEGVWTNWPLVMGLYFDGPEPARQAAHIAELPGYDKIANWFRVDSCWAGPGDVYSDLTVLARGPVDRVRWLNPVAEKTPPLGWDDFLLNFDDAAVVVGKCGWIEEWRRAGRDHRVRLQLAAKKGFVDSKLQSALVPHWRAAGLPGEPTIEVCLERGDRLAGRVFLSHAQPVALIVFAAPGEGEHWFDGLDVSFHPRAPTYVRVDASGRAEERTGTPDPSACARTHFSIR